VSGDDDILASLRDCGLLAKDEVPTMTPLSGGVSCDVLRVDCAKGVFVAKRALPQLRVTAEWKASPERSHNEVAWIRFVAGIEPRWVPEVVAEDRAHNLFVMKFFPPADNPLWKDQLRDGEIDVGFAEDVGRALAVIHARSVGSDSVAQAFAADEMFFALRIDPYILQAARAHPDRAGRLSAIADGIQRARIALMQGDVSPKNILRGPQGPVFLDSETACYGDPAFDLAFCLNHLLLKCVWKPAHVAGYLDAFAALRDAYLAGVGWEDAGDLDARTAAILSALLLARVDGKSPVEYLTSDGDKGFVREVARALLAARDLGLNDVLTFWRERLGQR
jgi:hypothetical protein